MLKRSKIQVLHNLRNRWGSSFWQLPLTIKLRLRTSYEFSTRQGTCWCQGTQSIVNDECLFDDDPVLSVPFWYESQYYRLAPKVTLVGKDATPLLADGRILLTSKRDQPKLFREEFPRDFGVSQITNRISGLVLSVVSRLDGVYYHWLAEQIPQVMLFRDYCSQVSTVGSILLRENAPRFQAQSIRAIWPNANIVTYSPDTFVDTLYVSTLPTAGFAAHPVVSNVRKEVLALVDNSRLPRRNLLYLYRKPTAWRTVENDREVKELITEVGGDIIDPGDYTFTEQVEFFATSACIVSIFGSGLTNCLFATGADIVELAGDYNDVSFASLSTFAGNRQHRFYCQQSGENIIVNVNDLRLFLQRILK